MTDMVTRVAEALGKQLKVEESGFGYVSPMVGEDGEDTDIVIVDAHVSLRALAVAAIGAMRQPTDAMMSMGEQRLDRGGVYLNWIQMIDAALKEHEGKSVLRGEEGEKA
jgi:hypothetical protein